MISFVSYLIVEGFFLQLFYYCWHIKKLLLYLCQQFWLTIVPLLLLFHASEESLFNSCHNKYCERKKNSILTGGHCSFATCHFRARIAKRVLWHSEKSQKNKSGRAEYLKYFFQTQKSVFLNTYVSETKSSPYSVHFSQIERAYVVRVKRSFTE